MRNLIKDIKTSVIATIFFAVLLGGIYPLAVWGFGRLLFPRQAEGSLIADAQGRVVGSALIGQQFVSAKYFHPRPSAAGNGYDPTASGGSNLGPTSRKLADAIKRRVADYRAENGLSADAEVPADAVTASASGLDPEISPRNARLQARRVAEERRLGIDQVLALVDKQTERRDLGVFGEPGVNVLLLNLDLDTLTPSR